MSAQNDSGSIPSIGAVLEPFTKAAKEINSFLGFPGVLLLFGLAALVLAATPGDSLSGGQATIMASAAFASSVATYLIQRYTSIKKAEAETRLLREYATFFLEKYFDGINEVRGSDIEWAIQHVVLLLAKEAPSPERGQGGTLS